MDYDEDSFLAQNKIIEDKFDHLIHVVENRLDKLFQRQTDDGQQLLDETTGVTLYTSSNSKVTNPYSSQSFSTFKSPYIRDFRNFAAPLNEDFRQIQKLTGVEHIESVAKLKSWSKETRQKLKESVLDYYSRLHILKLIKQKNELLCAPSKQDDVDVGQKLRLIDEQTEQVKARKEPRIFVPEDRQDTQIDWCAISATLSTSQHDAQDCRLMWSNELHWSVNDNGWTNDEDICLINSVAKHGKNDWERVARELNSGRLAWQCCARYNREFAHVPLAFDEDDNSKIIEVINLCRIGNFVPWNQVMYFIQYHGLHQVKYQWQKYIAEQRNTSNWTPEEDYSLLKAVERYGERDWCRIAEAVPGRSNKSCRERYMMRLKFQVRSVGSWKRSEDVLLMSLIEKFGTNWSIISTHFAERNSHQLRARFELLKNDVTKLGPIKHRKLYRNEQGEIVAGRPRRKRPQLEVEINEKLHQIFSTYLSVNKSSSRSLTCRSAQDEVIYQTLVRTLCDMFLERDKELSLLEFVIKKTVNPRRGLLMPCVPTLRAYKAWSLQQDYLTQFKKLSEEDEPEIDSQILKIVVSIFLWPAVLSRLRCPEVDVASYQVGSMIGRDSKNLYKIREIQRHMTT